MYTLKVKAKQIKTLCILVLIFISIKCAMGQTQIDTTLTLNITDEKLIKIFKTIESHGDYHFIFNPREIRKQKKKTSIYCEDASLTSVLNKLENDYPLSFMVIGSNISVACRTQPNIPQNITINGYVFDITTGEKLIGANVFHAQSFTGTSTDNNGNFSLTLPGHYKQITTQYLGYMPAKKEIAFNNSFLIIGLTPKQKELKEITINNDKENISIDYFNLGSDKMSISDIQKLPNIFAVNDVLHSLDFLPGISLNAEYLDGFRVRGSAEGENLTLLDNVPLYSTNHILGNQSIFNPDIVQNVTVYKGGVPSKYGGRAASLMNVITRNGNNQKFCMQGGISNMATRFSIEGPLFTPKLTYLISTRKGGRNMFTKAINLFDGNKLYFFDVNSKLTYQPNHKNKLSINTYWGSDKAKIKLGSYYGVMNAWDNAYISLNWNRAGNKKIISNLSTYISYYDYYFFQDNMYLEAAIIDAGFTNDYNWYKNPTTTIRFGYNAIVHLFVNPFFTYKKKITTDNTLSNTSVEYGAYTILEKKISNQINLKAGLRYNQFRQSHNYQYYYTYNEHEDDFQDNEAYNESEIVDWYYIPSPSFEANFKLSNNAVIKSSYNHSTQFLHQLLSTNTEGLLFKLFVPSTQTIKPLSIHHLSAGIKAKSPTETYSYSLESYYKFINNAIDYKDSVVTLSRKYPIDYYIKQGTGTAFGFEFSIRKQKGRFQGGISYSLSRSLRNIEGINNNTQYFASQHVPHDLSINANYQLTNRINVTSNFVFRNGRVYTPSNNTYERNNSKLPNYHRMDIGLNLKGKNQKRLQSEWNFSIFNIYNRQNTLFLYQSKAKGQQDNLSRYSLYGILPTVSWNFKF